ncbi:MAG: pyridoxamine 5'-phosphate oxidase [Mesorhizobium amorphae]|nr:MAG: pyridoxamine 5'-phosphate oxidase [Mesorhizobium amorphae]
MLGIARWGTGSLRAGCASSSASPDAGTEMVFGHSQAVNRHEKVNSMAETENPREKLYAMIDKVKIAMLTTIEKDGGLHSRPMANQESDESGNLWFFLDRTSDLAKTVQANSKVSLGYSDPSGDNYVAVSGTASLVQDRAKIEEKWSEDVAAWFEGGKDNPNIALLKVDPSEGEFWDTGSSALATAIGYVKAKLGKGDGSDVVENKKVSL